MNCCKGTFKARLYKYVSDQNYRKHCTRICQSERLHSPTFIPKLFLNQPESQKLVPKFMTCAQEYILLPAYQEP